MKTRIQIQFIDEHGMLEAGIDGGGLFKDFMENLIKEAFDPSAGLFNATSDNRLYPNPAAQLGNIDAMPMMEFLGSMLGKCVYEVRSCLPFNSSMQHALSNSTRTQVLFDSLTPAVAVGDGTVVLQMLQS